jgi:Spy/CpxP family protein refolding chaperone
MVRAFRPSSGVPSRGEVFAVPALDFGTKMIKRIALLIGFILFPIIAQAQAGPEADRPEPPAQGPMMGPMHHPMVDWVRRLNLTEEQMEKLRKLREAYLQDTLAWRNERLVKRYNLRNMLRDPQADAAKILAKQREISELDAKIQERTVLFQLAAREILTPEQLQLLPRDWGGEGFEHHRMMPGRGPRMER